VGLATNPKKMLALSVFMLYLLHECYWRQDMTDRAVLLREIETLPSDYVSEIIDFVGYLKEKKAKKTLSLKEAAEMMAEDYSTDKELTAFCALDGEDFYETR
jgi:hypothetical protein